jgi:adenine-specific DNA-methyltransferase
VKWKGGGDVIYCELAKANQIYIDLIQSAKKSEDLLKIWEDIKASSFISYQVDPRQFEENIKEFKELSLDNQRKFMIETLDKNMLYIPLSEIEDSTYKISKSDLEVNKNFFKIINE